MKSPLQFLAVAVLLFSARQSRAVLINPNDYLVSVNLSGANVIREYTSAGVLIQSIPFQYPGGSYPATENIRDIVVDNNGMVDAYNGTFNPFLTRYNSGANTFTSRTLDGLSTINNTTYGGIATIGHFVFMTDMATFGSPTQPLNGIVRFDLNSTAAMVRFAAGIDFIDLNIGLDGKLYGLYPGGSPGGTNVNVYDPLSLTLERTITFPTSITFGGDSLRGLAVDQNGLLYVVGLNGTVYKFGPNGALLTSRATGLSRLSDIDINAAGTLLVAQLDGNVLVGNTGLSPFTSFLAVPTSSFPSSIFVSFARPTTTIIPEPSAVWIGAFLALAVLGGEARRVVRRSY